jgi:hypothetical protein
MFNNSPYYFGENFKHNSSSFGSNLSSIVANSYDSLVDRVKYNSELSYDSVINDLDYLKLGKPIDKSLRITAKYVNKARDFLKSMALATLISVSANMAFTYFSHNIDVGYKAESASTAVPFGLTYIYTRRKSGVSGTRIAVDLTVMAAVGGALSIAPYQYVRSELIETFSNSKNFLELVDYAEKYSSVKDLTTPLAAGTSQLILAAPFFIALWGATKCVDYVDAKIKFKDKMVDGTKHLSKHVKKIGEGISDAIGSAGDSMKNGPDRF